MNEMKGEYTTVIIEVCLDDMFALTHGSHCPLRFVPQRLTDTTPTKGVAVEGAKPEATTPPSHACRGVADPSSNNRGVLSWGNSDARHDSLAHSSGIIMTRTLQPWLP
jgi:hypothetical protein